MRSVSSETLLFCIFPTKRGMQNISLLKTIIQPVLRGSPKNPEAVYACINYGEAVCPYEIKEQAICIDGGMTKLMIYHDDHGWTYTPEQ